MVVRVRLATEEPPFIWQPLDQADETHGAFGHTSMTAWLPPAPAASLFAIEQVGTSGRKILTNGQFRFRYVMLQVPAPDPEVVEMQVKSRYSTGAMRSQKAWEDDI